MEYECAACPRGLRGDARGPEGCQPVNECEEVTPCFPGATCEDLYEGYQCGECPAGYIGTGLRGYDIHDTSILQQVRHAIIGHKVSVQPWLRTYLHNNTRMAAGYYGMLRPAHSGIPQIVFTSLQWCP